MAPADRCDAIMTMIDAVLEECERSDDARGVAPFDGPSSVGRSRSWEVVAPRRVCGGRSGRTESGTARRGGAPLAMKSSTRSP